ncbi:hypothetical protein Tco_0574455, partial [Tanacetum coccineum]
KALYGLHQAPKAWYETLSTYLLDNEFQRRKIDKILFIKRHKDEFYERTYILLGKKDDIFISQDKYVDEILKKFGFTKVKTASTPIETQKTLLKDENGEEVDVHMFMSMIGSLMHLTSSRHDIMFVVFACARYHVNSKVSHLHAVKKICRYFKGQPKLGLWYPKDSPFDLVAYTDSDYVGASLDRKSTIGGCQFIGCILLSWQCKKQIVVENSTTEAEYVAASSCCGQVLWIQNQLLDYGYNFMHTKIFIDNNSINLQLLVKINAARRNLLLLLKVNATRHNLLLLVMVNVVEAQMANLKFVDTHNMVAFLSKPAKSEGFEQIMDFLNANPIRYALTINPTIYISCIKQFWSSVKAKIVNGEVQLQALVDGNKIIITESTVRRDLQLEDAEGIDCLPNATIFEQLALMGYEQVSQKLTFYEAFFSQQWKFLIHTILQCLSAKTNTWNEFSSTIASAVIYLATNQKLNFSKYIFESMVKNLENVSIKFLMYPRFVQVFLDQQLEGMSSHNRIYVTPSHTKKIFGNIIRVGKGFSGKETPLFQIMVVQEQAKMGKGLANPTDPHHPPTIIQPSPQPQKKQKPRKPKRKDTQIPQSSSPTKHVADEAVYKEMDDSLMRAATTASNLKSEQDSGGGTRCQETIRDTITQTRFENVSKLSNNPLLARSNTLQSGEDSLKLKELMELCTNLQTRVLDLEKIKTTQANEIDSLKRRVKRLEKKKRSRTHRLKRLYKVGLSARVESSGDEEDLGEDASKQGRINAIDVNEDITLVNDQDDADMLDVNTLTSDEVLAESEVAVKDVNLSVDEVTLAQALAALKSTKTTTTIISSQQPSQANVQDKGKGEMVEPNKPMKKKELIRLDEEIASKLQAEFDEEARLAREKAEKEQEANVALTKEWDDI